MPPITEYASFWEVYASYYRVCLLMRRTTPSIPPIYWEVWLLLSQTMPPIEKYPYYWEVCLLLQNMPPIEKYPSYWNVRPPITEYASLWDVGILVCLLYIEKYDSYCEVLCLLLQSMPPIEKYPSYWEVLCLLLQSMSPIEKYTSYWEVYASYYRVCLLMRRMTPSIPPIYWEVWLLFSQTMPPIKK